MPEVYLGPYTGFTLRSNGILRSINTDIFVSAVADIGEDGSVLDVHRPLAKTVALWDTGATDCVITRALASELGLSAIRQALTRHAGGESLANVYLIDIKLLTGDYYSGVTVTECENTVGDFGIIIGMDIICTGDFSISNKDGKTVVSFRKPSKKTIDFAIEIKQDNDRYYRSQRKAPKSRGR